jgi:transposase
MESTGVYWKCVYYVLEDDFEVLLVNAAHIKHVPGRKTDTIDAAWIAKLLAHGLLRPSFVPPKPIRELRTDSMSRPRPTPVCCDPRPAPVTSSRRRSSRSRAL